MREITNRKLSHIYNYTSLFHKQEQMDVFGSEAFKFELVQKLGKVYTYLYLKLWDLSLSLSL